jgi:AraC-like DNA-binding protein
MTADGPSRLLSTNAHDDGVNAWAMARYAPPPELSGLVRSYCDYSERTGGFTSRRELPHGEGVFIINLGAPIGITAADGESHRLTSGQGFIAGAHLGPAISSSGGTQAGIEIALPLTTLRRILGTPMASLMNRVVPLDAILGDSIAWMTRSLASADSAEDRIALLDTALIDRLRGTSALPPVIGYALKALANQADRDVADIAAEIGWSRKHLANRLRDAVGIGPRAWRRLIRFQRLAGAIPHGVSPNWAGLACDHGYADQAHMIREFREFAGITPTAFLAKSLDDGGGLIEE